VFWNGVSVLDLGPGGTLGPIATYTQYTVSSLLGTGSDTLAFLGRQDPGWDGLDDVDVEDTGVSGVPEPASLLLIAGALPFLWTIKRRPS
jgi:hypothetical protein